MPATRADIEVEIQHKIKTTKKDRKQVIEAMLEGALKGLGGAQEEVEFCKRTLQQMDETMHKLHRQIGEADKRAGLESKRIEILKQIREEEAAE